MQAALLRTPGTRFMTCKVALRQAPSWQHGKADAIWRKHCEKWQSSSRAVPYVRDALLIRVLALLLVGLDLFLCLSLGLLQAVSPRCDRNMIRQAVNRERGDRCGSISTCLLPAPAERTQAHSVSRPATLGLTFSSGRNNFLRLLLCCDEPLNAILSGGYLHGSGPHSGVQQAGQLLCQVPTLPAAH